MRARGWTWALVALLGLGAGCGKEHPAPTQPEVRLGPAVEEVFPTARSIRVPVDVVAWVRFRTPLDPATLVTTNVFLKLDTQRLPITLGYDPATRTLSVHPQVELKLRRTYTVELTPRVATADGVPLDSTYFWQFTTTTVRRLAHPVPADGAADQGPFAALGWDATESSAGLVRYDVFAGADSAQVATRATATTSTYYPYAWTPSPRAFDSTLWWTVRATNLETGEVANSPMWHFGTLTAGTPIESMVVPIVTYCSVNSRTPTNPGCNATSLGIGSSFNTAIRWSLAGLPAGARLAGARLMVFTIPSTSLNTAGTTIHATTTAFDGCSAEFRGPPTRDLFYGVLARGVYDTATQMLTLDSDALAAHLQCAKQFGLPSGYSFMADAAFNIYSTAGSETRAPLLRVYTYRTP
jgi:hypothetical protein